MPATLGWCIILPFVCNAHKRNIHFAKNKYRMHKGESKAKERGWSSLRLFRARTIIARLQARVELASVRPGKLSSSGPFSRWPAPSAGQRRALVIKHSISPAAGEGPRQRISIPRVSNVTVGRLQNSALNVPVYRYKSACNAIVNKAVAVIGREMRSALLSKGIDAQVDKPRFGMTYTGLLR